MRGDDLHIFRQRAVQRLERKQAWLQRREDHANDRPLPTTGETHCGQFSDQAAGISGLVSEEYGPAIRDERKLAPINHCCTYAVRQRLAFRCICKQSFVTNKHAPSGSYSEQNRNRIALVGNFVYSDFTV